MYLPFIKLNAHSINININKLWKWVFDVWTNGNTQNDYNAELIIKVGFINDLLILIITIIKATYVVTNRK